MPERTPKALRAAIAAHTPKLLDGFDAHWRRDIADAYDLAPVPAFMARWRAEYALARDPGLEAKVHRLEDAAGREPDYARAKSLIEEAGRIRREAAKAEPGGVGGAGLIAELEAERDRQLEAARRTPAGPDECVVHHSSAAATLDTAIRIATAYA